MRFTSRGGFYELNPFPGSNQIIVSNHAFIEKEMRGEGYGKLQHTKRIEKAIELGYDYILCTVREDNEVEKHILRKNGWTFHDHFTSRKSEHVVEIWGRLLYWPKE